MPGAHQVGGCAHARIYYKIASASQESQIEIEPVRTAFQKPSRTDLGTQYQVSESVLHDGSFKCVFEHSLLQITNFCDR